MGAAYLKQATTTMHDEILPAATQLYRDAALRLASDYRSGSSTSTLVVVAVAGLAMLALLIVVQVFVRRRSKRILNVGLVAATILVVGLFGWMLVRFTAGHDASNAPGARLTRWRCSRAPASSPSQAQNNENLALVERGTSDVYVAQFDRLMGQLGGTEGKSGLLGYTATIADRTGDGSRIRALAPQFTALRKLHSQVRDNDDGGHYTQAEIKPSIGTSDATQAAAFGPAGPGQELAAVDKLQHALQHDIARSQVRLAAAAQDTRSGYGVLEVAIPLFAVLAGLLVLLGLERRIGEYR